MRFTKLQFERFIQLLKDEPIELTEWDYRDNGTAYAYYKCSDHILETICGTGFLTIDLHIERNEDSDDNEVFINDIRDVYFDDMELELNGEFYSKLEKYIKQFLK